MECTATQTALTYLIYTGVGVLGLYGVYLVVVGGIAAYVMRAVKKDLR